MAVCYWHSFVWPGSDVFGDGTFDRPWSNPDAEPMAGGDSEDGRRVRVLREARRAVLLLPRPRHRARGRLVQGVGRNLDEMVEAAAGHMERTGVQLLWGTANLFSHPRYAAGAATNPDPEVFAGSRRPRCATRSRQRTGSAARTTCCGAAARATRRCSTPTCAGELDQLARFLHLVVEHKHRIGFEGTILIEPKPSEPTKHQYDFDAATVAGFLARHDLGEIKVNLEANHATLAGHSFHHEVATAIAAGVLGSIDANRGDPQNGWDTDQFPNSVEELSLVLYEILRAGRTRHRWLQLRHEAAAPVDGPRRPLPRPHRRDRHAGAGAARRRLAARVGRPRGPPPRPLRGLGRRTRRHRSLGGERVAGRPASTRDRPATSIPQPVSGRQELLENLVNRHIERAR